MTEDIVAHYRGLRETNELLGGEAMCVTFARGIDGDRMIRAFGGDPGKAEVTELEEFGDDDVVYVLQQGEWTIGIEDNGFQGSRPEVLRPLTVAGPALSVFWNVNGTNEFAYAADGRKAVSFDMAFPDPDRRHGSDPRLLDERISALPFGLDHEPYVAGLALATQLTGIRLTEELLSGTFRRAVLTAVPDDLVHESWAGDPALDEPLVRRLIAGRTPADLPVVRHRLAELIAVDAGLTEDPLITEVLTVLTGPAKPVEDLRQRLYDRYRTHYANITTAGAPVEERSRALQLAHAIGEIAAQLGYDSARPMPQGYPFRDHGRHIQYLVLKRIERDLSVRRAG